MNPAKPAHEVIGGRLLAFLGESDKVAVIASEEDLGLLTSGLSAALRISTQTETRRKMFELREALTRLREEAFGARPSQ